MEILDYTGSSLETSFHGLTITKSRKELEKFLGIKASFGDGEKTNYEWDLEVIFENNQRVHITIYDWKEERKPRYTDRISWHIGHKKEDLISVKKFIGKI